MGLDSHNRYTLESSYKLFNRKRDYYWLAGSWLVLLVWAYLQSLYTVLVAPLVVTILILLPIPRFLKKRIDIVISNDVLSIHEGEAVLWATPLRDITSIELEQKGYFQLGARKAMIIRNSLNDSYCLALDGMTFGNREVTEVISDLRSVCKSDA